MSIFLNIFQKLMLSRYDKHMTKAKIQHVWRRKPRKRGRAKNGNLKKAISIQKPHGVLHTLIFTAGI